MHIKISESIVSTQFYIRENKKTKYHTDILPVVLLPQTSLFIVFFMEIGKNMTPVLCQQTTLTFKIEKQTHCECLLD